MHTCLPQITSKRLIRWEAGEFEVSVLTNFLNYKQELRQLEASVENIIRREIEFMFGRRITTSRDCLHLSEEVFRITKSRLNSNTLRRFFGIVKTNFAPSNSTLQILCNYCGFLSVDDLKARHKETSEARDLSGDTALLNFLVNLFKHTPIENERNEVFKTVVNQTIYFLNQKPELVEVFQSMVAKTKNGQDYYFEGFSHIDKLDSIYGNGLRYYLKERVDNEGQIFGHSLLAFRYWLVENEINMEHHVQTLKSIGHHSSLSYCASGRYFASLLYEADLKKTSIADIIIDINNYNSSLVIDSVAQVEFLTIVAEALVLTGRFDLSLEFIDQASEKALVLQVADQALLQQLQLYKVFALYRSGEVKDAAMEYHHIKPTAFSFLNKKMLTVLYGFLTEKMRSFTVGNNEQWNCLIEETGFRRLKNLVNMKEEMA